MDHIRLGIIGIGNMGGVHARMVAGGQIPGCQLAAVCDVDPARLRGFPAVKTFADSAELIRSGLVDAVLIATPHYDHTPIGIDALEQGLHVLVEKPISVHKADCQRLIAAYARRPRAEQVFAAMFNQRTDPYYRKLRELIQHGDLGPLRRINWIITDWFRTEIYYASGQWRATWAGEGGGVLLNQATHNLDLFQWLFGMPSRVQARCQLGRYHQIEVEDDVSAQFEYPDGTMALFVTSTGEAPGTNRLEVVGERGRIVLEDDTMTFTRNAEAMSAFSRQSPRSYGLPARTVDVFRFDDRGGQHAAILGNFVAAIREGAPLIAPASEGIAAVELANAMLASSLRDETVQLPLDAAAYETLLGDLVRQSRYQQKPVRKPVAEVAPYLVSEPPAATMNSP